MAGTGLATQVTHGDESAYGTVAADLTRAYEIRSEGIEDAIERIESEALRAGRRITAGWKPNRKGAEGDIEYELGNKGFATRLKHAFGALAAPATPATAVLTRDHVATLGNINGKSFSTQIGRPDVTGTVQPFTAVGGKVAEYELACEVDGLVLWTETLDYQDLRTPSSTPTPGPALAAPAYAAGLDQLDFTGALINVAGAPVDVTSFTFHGNNGLKTDRYFLRRSALKKEPVEDTSPRELTVELGGEFDGLTAYNRFVNGTEATLTANFRGSAIETVAGPLTYYFEANVDFARLRWDGGTPTAGGADILEQPQTCKVLAPAAGEAVTFRYRTTDTTA